MLIDHESDDTDDLPDDLQPDEHVVWVWLVAPDQDCTSVCFEKEMAERIAEMKTPDVDIKRTRMWFDSPVAEQDVHAVPGSGYDQ